MTISNKFTYKGWTVLILSNEFKEYCFEIRRSDGSVYYSANDSDSFEFNQEAVDAAKSYVDDEIYEGF